MKFGLKKDSNNENKTVEKTQVNYQEFKIEKETEESYPHVVNTKDKSATFDVYIGRPSEYGNPFVIGKDGNRDEVIEKFENYLINNKELLNKVQTELKGKVLGCFCHPLKCHGDVLIKYANPSLNKNSTIKNRI